MEQIFGNLLHINLTTHKIEKIREKEEIFRDYIGGSGYGAYLICQNSTDLPDPLDPKSPLLFMTGPITGTPVPTSGRHTVIARSPLTGIWGEASVGGHWGRELRRAGYDGVVVEGKSEKPVYIWISTEGVEIRDAAHVWGMECQETDSLLRKETDGNAVVSTIGPAGENLVPMAGIFTDGEHARTAARCGLGAVAGSKGLKAIVVRGKGKIPVRRPDALQESIKGLIKSSQERTKGLSLFGTPGLVIPCEQIGDMPIRNWRQGSWPKGAETISGQKLKETFLKGQFRCAGCPIGCGRVVELDGISMAGPEYETLGIFGGSCLIDNLEAICRLNRLCNQMGLDTIETGAMVAFAMELYEQGILSKTDADGLDLTWGNWQAAMELVRKIGRKEGLGAFLGRGLKETSQHLGGLASEFALHVKGMAPPAHDPRAYNSVALGYATSNRGACHLQGFTHIFERNIFFKEWGYDKPLDRFGVEKKGELVAKSQDLMALFDSLALCKFSIFGGVTPSILTEWLNYVTGWDIGIEELSRCGERIFNLKRLYNVRLGISRKDDRLPDRLLTHRRKEGGAAQNLPPLHIMLSDYYEYRGWNEFGIPRSDKLESLRINPI
jgi:aldehyde:ferredoxin oxidoreductase